MVYLIDNDVMIDVSRENAGAATYLDSLQGVSFTSPTQLREAIDKFGKAYNKNAAPYEWTKAAVHQTAPKPKYADLCN